MSYIIGAVSNDNAITSNGRDFYFGFIKPATNYIHPVILVETLNDFSFFSIDYPIANRTEGQSSRNHPYTLNLDFPKGDSTNPYKLLFAMDNNDHEKGYHLTVNGGDSGILLKCYVMVRNEPSASYLALPYTELLVDEYEYFAFSASYRDDDGGPWGALLIVGNRNDTEITITPTVDMSLPRNVQESDSEEITVQAGETFRLILHSVQTLLLYGKDIKADITGTRLVSNQPLTVISGHSVGTLLPNGDGYEPMAQQMLPSALWGKSFLLLPFVTNIGQYFRVLGSTNKTSINYYCSNGLTNVSSLSVGEDYMFHVPPQVHCYLESETPVLIMQYSDVVRRVSDVTMINVAAIGQYSNRLTLSPLKKIGTYQTEETSINHYVSIGVPVDHFNENQILYNDKPLEVSWTSIRNFNGSIVGYGCGFQFQVAGTHHLLRHSGAKGKLFAMVYGFHGSRAYGYPAGLTFPTMNGK